MSREKGPDEIFCRSCGEPIKKKAEICPECGVPNEYTDPQRAGSGSRSGGSAASSQQRSQQRSTGSRSTPEPAQHDPSRYSTTVSNTWHYGVGASVVLWCIGFALPEGSGLAGGLLLIAWVLMPVSVYYDRQWLRATSNWNPDSNTWILLSVVPLVNVVAGAVYLFRRFNTSQVTSPNSSSTTGAGDDAALAKLRERYSSGELTDEEFERKVDRIVGTENRETAQVHARTTDRSDDGR